MNDAPERSAVIYARVSSRKQVKEGGGIESQATRCRAYASSRGYEVVARLVDKMLDTDNAVVTAQIEKRLTALEEEKLLLTEKIENLGKPARGFDEMFEHALRFLASPYDIWKNGTFADRRNVLKLAFTGRLKYCRDKGLRTPETSLPFKVLGGFWDGEKAMARPTGFEPVAPRLGI